MKVWPLNQFEFCHLQFHEKIIETRFFITGNGNNFNFLSFSRFRSSNSVSKVSQAGSIELPIFSDATDEDYEPFSKDMVNSSPEQETVLPKTIESTRPHIQNVFSTQTSQPSEDDKI